MSDDDLEGARIQAAIVAAGVHLTPTESNEVIMEKLDCLEPRLQSLLADMQQLRADLANGMIPWEEILERHRCDD